MIWQRQPWLIDHGAALYAQHDWASVDAARARTPFPLIERHVLIRGAESVAAADDALAPLLDEAIVRAIVDAVPDDLFEDDTGPVGLGDFPDAAAARARYVDYILTRLEGRASFVDAAESARVRLAATPPERLRARR